MDQAPAFCSGQRLSAQALNAIMGDELRRERLTRVALHGHGVVFGYAFAREEAAAISAGQASHAKRRSRDRPRRESRGGDGSSAGPPRRVEKQRTAIGQKLPHDDCGCGDRDDRRLKLTGPCIDITCGLIIDRHGRDLYWQGGLLGVHDLAGREPDKGGLLCA